jgi:hypothetical protein
MSYSTTQVVLKEKHLCFISFLLTLGTKGAFKALPFIITVYTASSKHSVGLFLSNYGFTNDHQKNPNRLTFHTILTELAPVGTTDTMIGLLSGGASFV